MFGKFLLFCLVIAISEIIVTECETEDDRWNSFKHEHGRKYKDAEEERISKIEFVKTDRHIREINARNLSYRLAHNKFSDWTPEKRRQLLGRIPPSTNRVQGVQSSRSKRQSYSPINWSSKFLAAIDQLSCGSCWAFATAGAVEGNRAIKFPAQPRVYLSPQQLVDCDTEDNGCNGGYYGSSFSYVTQKGLEAASIYAYTGTQASCKYNSTLVKSRINGTNYCSNYASSSKYCSPSKIYALLANGPVAVGIDGSSDDFYFYESGVFGASCYEDNHAVILVGYGVDPSYGPYYIIRNSWGSSWGDNGYIRIAANEANNYSCFVTNEGYQPIVVS